MTIALITDTDASLPLEIAQRYDIHQVPIVVQFGEESLRAVYDVDDRQLFQRIQEEGLLPTTSAPSPGQFAEAYQHAVDAGADEILCITVSSAVSATYSAALNARHLVPQANVTVLDSQSLSIGQGFMVLAAAEALQEGASLDEAVQAAESTRERTHLFAALGTLKYLAMSGRVGNLAAGLANILSIKPILTIREGKLDMLEKVRTRKLAWQRVMERSREALGGRRIVRAAILDVAATPENHQRFESLAREMLPLPADVMHVELTPGLSVHAGDGVLGIAFVSEA